MLPQDPAILLSYVNTCLRDGGCTLEDFCLEHDVSRAELEEKLSALGCSYHQDCRRFF